MNGYWLGKAGAKQQLMQVVHHIDPNVVAWKKALLAAKKAGLTHEIMAAQKGLAAAEKVAFLKAHGLAVKVAAPAAVKMSGLMVKGAVVVGSAIATIIASQFTN